MHSSLVLIPSLFTNMENEENRSCVQVAYLYRDFTRRRCEIRCLPGTAFFFFGGLKAKVPFILCYSCGAALNEKAWGGLSQHCGEKHRWSAARVNRCGPNLSNPETSSPPNVGTPNYLNALDARETDEEQRLVHRMNFPPEVA